MLERIASLIVVVGLATPAAAGELPIPAPDIGAGPLGVLAAAAAAAVYALRRFRRKGK